MKLTVEIKDGSFIYEYQVGESRHHSIRKLCADSLVRFVNLLSTCSQHFEYQDRQWEREIVAAAAAEKKKEGG